jgi:hypothetical protein
LKTLLSQTRHLRFVTEEIDDGILEYMKFDVMLKTSRDLDHLLLFYGNGPLRANEKIFIFERFVKTVKSFFLLI